MIALITTYFLAFYILIPGVLFRFSSSLFVKLKLFQRNRTQEATFAVAVAIVPFGLALAGAWYVPIVRQYPFQIAGATLSQRRDDYRRATAVLMASDASRLLNSDSSSANQSNWRSLDRVLRRQGRFLVWYFAATVLEGLLFGFLASKYGDWHIVHSSRRPALPLSIYNWVVLKFILPNVSEWHRLLTDFEWPKNPKLIVVADILLNDGHLYKGHVENHFLDSDGKLTGILLTSVERFDLDRFLAEKGNESAENPIHTRDRWRKIPSQNFYIGQAAISNLNVRFAPREEKVLLREAGKVLKEEKIDANEFIVVSDSEAEAGQNRGPDLYS